MITNPLYHVQPLWTEKYIMGKLVHGYEMSLQNTLSVPNKYVISKQNLLKWYCLENQGP